ncbi:uncharacterized protein At2g29880-like [Magnolia sinica]|uniref:uncharacterized protein At2g29880-like n=1 Tax=Magnolia sinica TaxID=86752 RepID=UPI0026587988|nr:uncharacterized protein At2g29880-like [Magnolia sinica]
MLAASGFGWDNERMVVTAPDEVWEEYLKSHPHAARLRGKRIERMDDLGVIVGSDQVTGRYVKGSRTMAASSSRINQDLNETWTELDDDLDDHVDLSDDTLGDSIGTMRGQFSSDTPSMPNRCYRGTPTQTSDTDHGRSGSGSSTKKRQPPP